MKRVCDYWFPDCDDHWTSNPETYQNVVYEEAMKEVRNCFSTPGLAVDIGAHVGIFTRRMLRDFCEVRSFEPNADNYACLVRNCQKAITVHGALGDSIGFGFSVVDAIGNTGARSFSADDGGDVPMFMLDEFDIDPHMIKIDTQGYEHRIISGSINVLTRSKPVLIVERPRSETILLLKGVGYGRYKTCGKDAIFVRN